MPCHVLPTTFPALPLRTLVLLYLPPSTVRLLRWFCCCFSSLGFRYYRTVTHTNLTRPSGRSPPPRTDTRRDTRFTCQHRRYLPAIGIYALDRGCVRWSATLPAAVPFCLVSGSYCGLIPQLCHLPAVPHAERARCIGFKDLTAAPLGCRTVWCWIERFLTAIPATVVPDLPAACAPPRRKPAQGTLPASCPLVLQHLMPSSYHLLSYRYRRRSVAQFFAVFLKFYGAFTAPRLLPLVCLRVSTSAAATAVGLPTCSTAVPITPCCKPVVSLDFILPFGAVGSSSKRIYDSAHVDLPFQLFPTHSFSLPACHCHSFHRSQHPSIQFRLPGLFALPPPAIACLPVVPLPFVSVPYSVGWCWVPAVPTYPVSSVSACCVPLCCCGQLLPEHFRALFYLLTYYLRQIFACRFDTALPVFPLVPRRLQPCLPFQAAPTLRYRYSFLFLFPVSGPYLQYPHVYTHVPLICGLYLIKQSWNRDLYSLKHHVALSPLV